MTDKYQYVYKRISLWIFLQLSLLPFLAVQGQNFTHSLDGSWAFQTDLYQVGDDEQWFDPAHSIQNWDNMEVPGNWDLENEYAYYTGQAWYRKNFKAPQSWQGKAIKLLFEAVYNDTEIWLNGEKLGEHHIGFLAFSFYIQDKLKYGQTNTLVLKVDNTFKRGAIWNWGGIRRSVSLEISNPLKAEYLHVDATPNLNAKTAKINLSFPIQNHSSTTKTIKAEVNIYFNKQKIASKTLSSLSIQAKETQKASLSINLTPKQTHLWHFNHPHLYTAELILKNKRKEIYKISDKFGVRKIEVDGYELKLNGEAVRLMGFNLVPEDRSTGSTMPLWRVKEDIDVMKSLGCNMARLSHLPTPKAFLDYLDEKGIMVFEEVSLWGKDAWVDPEHPMPKYWLKSMIRERFNHPSVIGWSVGNEIGFLTANPKVMDYVKGAIEMSKKLDPNRLAVYVSHSADQQSTDPVEFSDLIMLNKYGGWGKSAERAHKKHPGKPIFYSEFGKNLNSVNPNLSEIDIQLMMKEMRNRPYVIGGSLWTFNDYRSTWKASPTWTTDPSENRAWGIVDVFRNPKKSYNGLRKEYAPIKNLSFSHQNNPTPGKENQSTITLTPRGIDDLPAFNLENYQLLWHISDQQQQIIQGGLHKLPIIKPGSTEYSTQINWQWANQAALMKLELRDPQGYNVADTTIYLQKPEKPSIKHIHTGTKRARIIFEANPLATAYKVKYGFKTLDKETPLSINPFIDIGSLKFDSTYQFQLIAVNALGESTPSEIITARIDEDVLPPMIWHTEPDDQSFFVSYSVDRTDYMFEVQYGTQSGKYDKIIGLRNQGVLKIPNLKNGQEYFYRFRRRKQWGFASEWSHEITVTPDGDQKPSAPKIFGTINADSEVVMLFEPVRKAIAYKAEIKDAKTNQVIKTIHLNSAKINAITFDDLANNKDYIITLSAQNAYGWSEPTMIDVKADKSNY